MADKLSTYKKKRDFKQTQEPSGSKAVKSSNRLRFIIQKHDATRLHYDLRLELDGVFKSWAVTKGPSLDPHDKRLAVEVEDHPLDYGDFEGTIPKGQYGGGTVMLWDRGYWEPEGNKSPEEALKKGDFKFLLNGKRLHGSFVLVRMRNDRDGGKRTNWLLISARGRSLGRAGRGLGLRLPAAAAKRAARRDLAAYTDLGDEYRVRSKLCREQALEVLDLRHVVVDDIGIGRVVGQEILMVALRRIEGPVRLDGGDDGGVVEAGLVQLVDIGFGHARVLGAGGKDRRAVLRAGIRSLTVQFGRIVGDREINLQQLAIADFLGIEGDADRLGMADVAIADRFVMRRRLAAARIAGTALLTPATRWNTPWTPQKQPPANTAVSFVALVSASSSVGAGMAMPSCAAACVAPRSRPARARMADVSTMRFMAVSSTEGECVGFEARIGKADLDCVVGDRPVPARKLVERCFVTVPLSSGPVSRPWSSPGALPSMVTGKRTCLSPLPEPGTRCRSRARKR